jgi:hypothetical protein
LPPAAHGAAGIDFFEGVDDAGREEVRLIFADRAAARAKFRTDSAEMYERLSAPQVWLKCWGDRAGTHAAHRREAAEYLTSTFKDGWTNGDDGWWDDWHAP